MFVSQSSKVSSYFSKEGCPSNLRYTSVLADCDTGGLCPATRLAWGRGKGTPSEEQNEGCSQPNVSSLQVGVGLFEVL